MSILLWPNKEKVTLLVSLSDNRFNAFYIYFQGYRELFPTSQAKSKSTLKMAEMFIKVNT